MSRLDDIKEQLKAQSQQIWQKIQESSSYVQLQDRYQSLNPSSQKAVRYFAVFIVLVTLLYYPLTQYLTSQESLIAFEEKRNLIRELFKTYRESSARPNISIPPPIDSLRTSITSILTMADLTAEQNLGINDISMQADSKIIPKTLIANALEIRLSKLNIKQIVDIGTQILGISESVKMKDISIIAHPADSRYFDVSYKLYSLNVPEPTPEPPPEIEKPQKGKKTDSKNKEKGSDE